MRILACEEDTDLRTVTHHRKFLQRTARIYRLEKFGDAVIFNGKSKDRYRLVVHMGSGPMMVMPETEMDKRVSRYLRVSIQLRDFAQDTKVISFFNERINHAKTRVARAKKLRAARAASGKE